MLSMVPKNKHHYGQWPLFELITIVNKSSRRMHVQKKKQSSLPYTLH